MFCSFRIKCVILRDKTKRDMNYQEMVNAQQSLTTHQEPLPFGKFYRKQVDGKYRLVIDLKQDLSDSIVFCEALKKDQLWSVNHGGRQQVQFVLDGDVSSVHRIDFEQGNFQTLSQLLLDEPATIAAKGFVERVVNDLFDMTDKLHADGIYQLCYAPQNIFVRKGDTTPLLLCHGSFYKDVNDVKSLYEGVEDYVAPEVMNHEDCDERSDIYGMGKLIEYLFSLSSMPFEYKQVVKKATAADPAKRFKSLAQMRSAITARRSAFRSGIALAAAVVIALLAIRFYFEMMPQTEYIEFVEPVKEEVSDDPYTSGQYELDHELIVGDDSIPMSEEDRLYMAKAEEIFKKRFEAAAEKTLSKVYDNSRMSSSEKKILTGNQAMADDLLKQQMEMAKEMGISEEHAAAIAEEVINRITTQKQQGLGSKGFIRGE